METSFKNLTQEDKIYISNLYLLNKQLKDDGDPIMRMENIQKDLADRFKVTTRTIRNWARKLGLNLMIHSIEDPFKILVYDIETSRVKADVFWTGKQYISHAQLTEEPKIISVAWKWLGQDKVHYLTWDKNHSDKKLMEEFLVTYNKAGMVIGYNNDRFDNRWINARAIKYRLEVNLHV